MRPIERLALPPSTRKDVTINMSRRPEEEGNGWFYPFMGGGSADREMIDSSFVGYVESAYKRNGIVFACVLARMMPYSEVVFRMQNKVAGRWGKLVDDASLQILESPWPNGTTGELLKRMEQDASLAGNFYCTPVEGRIRRLRPDWVIIVSGVKGDPSGSPYDLDAEVLCYLYVPPGRTPMMLTPDQVVHYSPIPDPEAQWRGMSWLTPILREIRADTAATKHKLKFFEHGATLGTVISYDAGLSTDEFQKFVEIFKQLHGGVDNAYKTLHIGGGATPTVTGGDLKQIDFKVTQGAGETRIAAAAGVGAIIGRFSEGLQGSALNAGNYGSAVRQFADLTIRPLWRDTCGSLAKLTKPGGDQRLWYDDHDVEFLKEDRKDAAEIQAAQATSIKTLVEAGFTADSVTTAITTGDLDLLVHSGLLSVQLQAPGSRLLPDGIDPSTTTVLAEKAVLAALLKVGARNSATDQTHIQTAHDELVSAGAVCEPED